MGVLVPGGGVEPPRGCPRRILSPLRLPVPPSRRCFRGAVGRAEEVLCCPLARCVHARTIAVSRAARPQYCTVTRAAPVPADGFGGACSLAQTSFHAIARRDRMQPSGGSCSCFFCGGDLGPARVFARRGGKFERIRRTINSSFVRLDSSEITLSPSVCRRSRVCLCAVSARASTSRTLHRSACESFDRGRRQCES